MLYYYYDARAYDDNGAFYRYCGCCGELSGTNQEFGVSCNTLWINRLFVHKTPDERGATGDGGGGDGEDECISDRADEQITQPNSHPTKKGINLLACPFPE